MGVDLVRQRGNSKLKRRKMQPPRQGRALQRKKVAQKNAGYDRGAVEKEMYRQYGVERERAHRQFAVA